MAFEIRVPRLGWTMESGTFAGWLKKDGETVEEGTPILAIESDKALQEVEAMASGVLRISPDCPQAGTTVEVGALLGYIAAPGEVLSREAASPRDEAPVAAAAVAAAPPPPPEAPREAIERAPDAPSASPRARRVARELGVDWTRLRGSGHGGRVVERDVRRAAELAAAGAIPPPPPPEPAAPASSARAPAARAAAASAPGAPLSAVRAKIAERMRAGHLEAAPVTLIAEADATELFLLKERLQASAGLDSDFRPTFTDLFVLLSARALTAQPELNARMEGGRIFREAGVHIALAVDTPDGLLAPVIREADRKDLKAISRETREAIEKARSRRLLPEELQGGTFTLSNLGMYRVDAFTPILNLPQCAVLGVGRIAWKPAVHEGRVAPRQRVTLSLTFDHRALDGAPAARFLTTVCEYVERPETWFERA